MLVYFVVVISTRCARELSVSVPPPPRPPLLSTEATEATEALLLIVLLLVVLLLVVLLLVVLLLVVLLLLRVRVVGGKVDDLLVEVEEDLVLLLLFGGSQVDDLSRLEDSEKVVWVRVMCACVCCELVVLTISSISWSTTRGHEHGEVTKKDKIGLLFN